MPVASARLLRSSGAVALKTKPARETGGGSVAATAEHGVDVLLRLAPGGQGQSSSALVLLAGRALRPPSSQPSIGIAPLLAQGAAKLKPWQAVASQGAAGSEIGGRWETTQANCLVKLRLPSADSFPLGGQSGSQMRLLVDLVLPTCGLQFASTGLPDGLELPMAGPELATSATASAAGSPRLGLFSQPFDLPQDSALGQGSGRV